MAKHFYGLLTVRLDNTPVTDDEVMDRIKTALGIKAPVLDEDLGLLHGAAVGSVGDGCKAGEKFYVVGVESSKLWELASSGNPVVVGCFHNLAYSQDNKPTSLKAARMPQYKKPKGPGF